LSRLFASSKVAFDVEDEGIIDLLDAPIPYLLNIRHTENVTITTKNPMAKRAGKQKSQE